MFPSQVEIISKGYFSLQKATEKRAKSFGKIKAKEYVVYVVILVILENRVITNNEYVDDGDNELGTL